MDKIVELKFELLENLPYQADLAPSDIFIFELKKIHLCLISALLVKVNTPFPALGNYFIFCIYQYFGNKLLQKKGSADNSSQ